MKIETHIIANNGDCARCGVSLPDPQREGNRVPLFVGDRVGLITGLRWSLDASYVITSEHDTNPPCKPLS